ncbi:LacI family transcriptional regulator [Opitutaceae bacterium TAV4]|uniref:LacI family DNA-binding transcriptional regulator n=1 Tax=Geminisphaera colitermitum TaxID=1148786 RepID=UPI000158D25F|nr:LacI family DNA-binding transcriptional regulator [Geminisphaera colitermitum]RRJ94646.1 LacI family transcriptional regulator [Opitutaceae bacterium TAV4]RRJ98714.1 LacI family transcriptional regulator [Opitutaceae bacterium TAV3]
MPSFTRPTMRIIAAKAKVSAMTVSLALRDHASIPEATRLRIKTIANELGYRPDPVLRAFHSYRRNSRQVNFQGTLAWVNNFAPDHPLRAVPTFNVYHQGAARRAEQLGYKLEKFWLGAPDMSQERMTDILLARNITGLLLPPQPDAHMELHLDWARFAVVTFGYTLVRPRFHSVCNHHYQSVLMVIQKLRERGCERIGFALSAATNERVHRHWLAGFLVEQQTLPKQKRIDPLMITGGPPRPDVVGKWIRRWRPDAVVSIDPLVAEAAQAAGIRVPEDMAFALCGDSTKEEFYARIDENSNVIGATAVDMLAGMLQRNECGIPAHPIRMMIEGSWVEGPSAPPTRTPVAN